MEGQWQLTRQLSLALSALNVNDKYPTRSMADISYFGNLPYDVLSPIGFGGAYYAARLRWVY